MILRHLQVFLTTFATIQQENYNMRNKKRNIQQVTQLLPIRQNFYIITIHHISKSLMIQQWGMIQRITPHYLTENSNTPVSHQSTY